MITVNSTLISTSRFPNGELHLKLKDFLQNNPKNIVITWKYESDGEFFQLKLIKDYFLKHLPKAYVELRCLYLPYSRMDRSENDSVFSLESVSVLLNSFHFDKMFIGEPHSKVSLDYTGAEAINITEALYKEHKESLKTDMPLISFYPDDGAKKRYAVDAEINLVGNKTRNFATGQIESYEVVGKELLPAGDFDVVILDDLSSFGGTFVRAAEELRKIGARKVYLIVAHAENNIFKGKLFDHIDKIITTNSILDEDSEESLSKIAEEKLVIKKMI